MRHTAAARLGVHLSPERALWLLAWPLVVLQFATQMGVAVASSLLPKYSL